MAISIIPLAINTTKLELGSIVKVQIVANTNASMTML
jgi:hypothetical protein